MFSGTVKILDLNDYINPSEECIVITEDKDLKKNIKDNIELPDLIKKSKNQKAQIKLEDCLACSGCITSSETLLVEEQSIQNLLKSFQNFDLKILLISPQSRISIANKLSISEIKSQILLEKIAQKIGFNHIVDFEFFVQICNYLEYLEYLKFKNDNKVLLTSECPGWICYLEKVVGDKIIPFASSIKPPQLQCAHFLKNIFQKVKNLDLSKINVSLLAPCFDKKLEAIREEQKNGCKIIDIVISTKEIFDYANDQNFFGIEIDQLKADQHEYFDLQKTIENFINSKEKIIFSNYQNLEITKSFENFGSSNGYLDFIITQQIKLHNAKIFEIKTDKRRLVEITLEYPNQKKETLALVYGFKNIQNMIRKIKMKKIKYSYCEVMACPSGCLGGGAQISYDSTVENKKQIEKLIEQNQNKSLQREEDLVKSFYQKFIVNQNDFFSFKDIQYKIEPIKKNNTSWQLIIFFVLLQQIIKLNQQIKSKAQQVLKTNKFGVKIDNSNSCFHLKRAFQITWTIIHNVIQTKIEYPVFFIIFPKLIFIYNLINRVKPLKLIKKQY